MALSYMSLPHPNTISCSRSIMMVSYPNWYNVILDHQHLDRPTYQLQGRLQDVEGQGSQTNILYLYL